MPHISIRPFNPESDYPTLSALWNTCYPRHPMGVRDFTVDDEGFYVDPEQTQFKRFVVEVEGRVVGTGQRFRPMIDYHPHRFRIESYVAPDARCQGIGTQLYETIMADMANFKPNRLITQAWGGHPDGVRFIEKLGFHLKHQHDELCLDITAFDPTPFTEHANALQAQGFAFMSMTDAYAQLPDFLEQLYTLDKTVTPDIPGIETDEFPEFETWQKHFYQPEPLDKNISSVVIFNGRVVASSELWVFFDTPNTHFGLAAVYPEFRGKGLTKALKTRVISHAQSQGKTIARTINDETNAPMQKINLDLGFKPDIPWLNYEKEIK